MTLCFILPDHLNLYLPIKNHHIYNHLCHSSQKHGSSQQNSQLSYLHTPTYTHTWKHTNRSYTILLPPPNNSMHWILVTLRWWDSTTSYEDQHSFNNSSLSCWLSQNLSLPLEVCFDPIQILQLGRIAYHGILIITAFGIPTF